MEIRDKQVLTKILDETNIIETMITGNDFKQFTSDEKTKRAVCMTLINIGELVKTLSEDFKLSNPSVPWKAIAGLRDVTAHRYQTLKMEDVWATVEYDLPKLKEELGKLIL